MSEIINLNGQAATPEPEKPKLTITPFPDTGEIVRAYPHPKFEGQFILADAAKNIFAIVPSPEKAQLVYESLNGYLSAAALHRKMLEEAKDKVVKRIITP